MGYVIAFLQLIMRIFLDPVLLFAMLLAVGYYWFAYRPNLSKKIRTVIDTTLLRLILGIIGLLGLMGWSFISWFGYMMSRSGDGSVPSGISAQEIFFSLVPIMAFIFYLVIAIRPRYDGMVLVVGIIVHILLVPIIIFSWLAGHNGPAWAIGFLFCTATWIVYTYQLSRQEKLALTNPLQQPEPRHETRKVRQEEVMTLRAHAKKMIDVLGTVCVALDAYDADARKLYAKDLASRLRPLVKTFETAVMQERSREQAQEILTAIMPIMDEVNEATTKGEMALFKDETLKVFWDLSTIFCESRFSGESLG
jgi:hypothetical protein